MANPGEKTIFFLPSERERRELRPGVVARTFWGDHLLVSLVELEANAVLPAHSHPHEQSTYVLEGELKISVGGEQRMLKAGDLVIIPGDVEHTVWVGAQPALVLDTFSPVREDLKY